MDRSMMAEEEAEGSAAIITLPDDILYRIHAFMSMRDAAQAACVSRAFLHSWRSYPKLIFDIYTLGVLLADILFKIPIDKELLPIIAEDQINNYQIINDPMVREFARRVDHIMHNHTGTGIAIFWLEPPPYSYIDPAILDRWFQAVFIPPTGILHFGAFLDMDDDGLGYTFPCFSLLSTDSRGCSTVASFTITGCRLGPGIDRVGCLVNLKRLELHKVRVTGDELCCFLSASPVLDELDLSYCHDIVCLKIPRLLSCLESLHVGHCNGLQTIQCDAPNLSTFSYVGLPTTCICLGDSAPLVKEMKVSSVDDEHGMLSYATTKLPSVVPNLSSLSLSSCFQVTAATQMKKLNKFRHLKNLKIRLHTPSRCTDYDFYSLVSFLNVCPALHTFILQLEMHDAAAGDAIPGGFHGDCSSSQEKRHGGGTGGQQRRHRKLKRVVIIGFRSAAKGLVELTNHILEHATSLKQLVLDTAYGRNMGRRCMCTPLTLNALMEAREAVDVIKRCIQGQVPSSVKFKVIEPCIKCHTDEACKSKIIN